MTPFMLILREKGGRRSCSSCVREESLFLYHLVCPAKYRKKVFTEEVEATLKNICFDIEQRYELYFVEIGADEDHIHFLIQSVPILSPTQIVKTTKSITAKELFRLHPEIRQMLWGGHIWTSGYYMNTVGRHGNEEAIRKYVQGQGKQYKQIHRTALREQLSLFDS